jgi:hypothetical protein
MPEPLPETTLAWLHQSAKFEGAVTAQVLLRLLERVEALEQRPIPGFVELAAPTPEAAPVATDAELKELCWGIAGESYGFSHTAIRAVYNLGRQHGAAQPPAAQPAPPPAPAGGLVERVEDTITGEWHQNSREAALSAIREVAYSLGDLGYRAAKAGLLGQVAVAELPTATLDKLEAHQ